MTVENLLSIVRLFADDTLLACSCAGMCDIEGILNYDLLVLSTWRKQWLVDFNPSKTEAIIVSCNDAYHFPNLMFEDVLVNFVEIHKHLGLTLSSNAKWHAHAHIENIITSISKLLGIMRAVKYQFSRKALNNIYISDIRPILEYTAVVWDGCTAYEKKKKKKKKKKTRANTIWSSQNCYRNNEISSRKHTYIILTPLNPTFI